MLLAPVFGQLAFDGGFEDGGFVAFEVGLDALEVGDGFVEAGELLFDLRDDACAVRLGARGREHAESLPLVEQWPTLVADE